VVCKFSDVCSKHSHNQTCDVDNGGPFKVSQTGKLIAYCGKYRILADNLLMLGAS